MSEEESPTESLREQAPPSVARDISITVVFMLLSVSFLIISRQFAGNRISDNDPGASFWPRATLVVILVAGALNLFLLYRRAQAKDEPMIPSFSGAEAARNLSGKQKEYLLAIALSTVFFFSLQYVGFFVGSPIFLFAFAYAIGYRDLGKLTVFSVSVALIVFFAFRNVMNIALPYGVGIFREASVWAANLF